MRSTNDRNSRVGRAIVTMIAVVASAVGLDGLEAQSALGVPYIGSNHLSFYSTELTSDGFGAAPSKLYGGRYGHRFGDAQATTRLSFLVQMAARDYEAVGDGVYDVSLSMAMSRTMEEVDPRLELAASLGGEIKAWGFDPDDTGLARVSVPLTVGASFDLRVGSVTIAPFLAPGAAYTMARQYVDDVRVMRENAWDLRLTSGASVRLKEAVFTTSHVRGEHGLPQASRWTFAAGISF